jgi:hypothetical protein
MPLEKVYFLNHDNKMQNKILKDGCNYKIDINLHDL